MASELNLTALRTRYEHRIEMASDKTDEENARFILRQIERVEKCECGGDGRTDCGCGHRSTCPRTIECKQCKYLRADLLALQREVLG